MVDTRTYDPRILSAATAVPPHRVEQGEIKEFARRLFADRFRDLDRLLPVFDNGEIASRHFCRPLEWFGREWSFPERNALYVEHTLELSEKAARRCLDRAGIDPEEVAALFFVSTSGISTPSLDAQLLFELGLSLNLKRVPVWGLGCAGGVARVAWAADHARAYPDEFVLVVAVELCGLTFQVGDFSKSNPVAANLFAGGAVAVLLGPRGTGGRFWGVTARRGPAPGTSWVGTWRSRASRFASPRACPR